MIDGLVAFLKLTLPDELSSILSDRIAEIERGHFEKVLTHPLATTLFNGGDVESPGNKPSFDWSAEGWNDHISNSVARLLAEPVATNKETSETIKLRQHSLCLIGLAALQSFVQSNITGPPLPFCPPDVLFPRMIPSNPQILSTMRSELAASLGIDGVAAYKLVPNVELFCLANTLLSCPLITENVQAGDWLRLRKDFIHQRILSEVSPTLQTYIYDNLAGTEKRLTKYQESGPHEDILSEFTLEHVTINLHYGFDKKARELLNLVSKQRRFDFALTGRLGRKTRFQEQDISQLVVLARSFRISNAAHPEKEPVATWSSQPDTINLDNDTLLEAVSFSAQTHDSPSVADQDLITESLRSLDPGNQPKLHPLDSIILLLLASSITNASPSDGLTREETLPYATRVLEGGSSNWQIYSHALLVRSRIEGYKSRTTERGLLQLQALVDQVIAETTSLPDKTTGDAANDTVSTFLPRAKATESAPVEERLRYVYQLCSPTRWELETELASRWISLGGLRSALEIYERLEMWPEAALCWAATEREDKAKKIIRKQLFHSTGGSDELTDADAEKWEGQPREPPPIDAARLYCILGDLDNDLSFWRKAWEISDGRYARAQRTIGRHHFAAKQYGQAAEAYSKALKIGRLHQPSWFALGCCWLALEDFDSAIEAFSRVIQLDDSDAEAWSNLAAALMERKISPNNHDSGGAQFSDEHDQEAMLVSQLQQDRKDAFQALKRAASLKYDDARIWENLLTVAASLQPPAYAEVVNAQRRIIELRGRTDGENCMNIPILENLVRHTISLPCKEVGDAEHNKVEHGLSRLVCELVDTKVVPLITTSARLWRLVGNLALWRQLYSDALQAQEKAWRAVSAQPGWEVGTVQQWEAVAEATEDLVDAYESLGERTSEVTGEPIAKDWKFKARSVLRGIMGKGRNCWEGTDAWERLMERTKSLKTT